VNDHSPLIDVVFLGADDDNSGSSGRVSIRSRPGDSVARVSVSDADHTDNITVQLRTGGFTNVGPFQLTDRGGQVYVVGVSAALTQVWYRLEVVATDSGGLSTSEFLDLFVDGERTDALRFSRSIYRGVIATDTPPGTCVTAVTAIRYELSIKK